MIDLPERDDRSNRVDAEIVTAGVANFSMPPRGALSGSTGTLVSQLPESCNSLIEHGNIRARTYRPTVHGERSE